MDNKMKDYQKLYRENSTSKHWYWGPLYILMFALFCYTVYSWIEVFR